jgi:hypothetical protein
MIEISDEFMIAILDHVYSVLNSANNASPYSSRVTSSKFSICLIDTHRLLGQRTALLFV